MFFRSSSKQKLPEPQQPLPFPKNPFNKEKIDSLIDLENRFHQNKVTEETVVKLMELYSVVCRNQGLVEHYDIVDDPIKEYFLDKLQSLEVKKRLLMIRKDQGLAKLDALNGSPTRGIRDIPTGLSASKAGGDSSRAANSQHINKEKDAIVKNFIKNESPVVALPPAKASSSNLLAVYQSRGKGSMDHKQRQVKKAKEITYLGQLGEMVATEKTNERASSIAKEFDEKRAKNDELIKDQLRQQNDKLLERLKERQINSFNRSLQKQGSFAKDKGAPQSEADSNALEDTSNILAALNGQAKD